MNGNPVKVLITILINYYCFLLYPDKHQYKKASNKMKKPLLH
ncbi:putative membrane protein [Marinomonas primoryensis]|uniref:Putative membrane protein n=1 Tax=Marinomonas primoryensis TaxID=178399 RepID=A0A859CSZ4_9GAMM|nr:putative membrane protein [Marinomonas primoryensis]